MAVTNAQILVQQSNVAVAQLALVNAQIAVNTEQGTLSQMLAQQKVDSATAAANGATPSS